MDIGFIKPFFSGKKFRKNDRNFASFKTTNSVKFPGKMNSKKFVPLKMQKEKEDLSEKNITILDFFQEVNDEIKMIEWPSVDRVFKQFVIVVISLVFSALFVFSIDGLFAAANKILFEGNF